MIESDKKLTRACHMLTLLSLPASGFLMWSVVRLLYYSEPTFWPYLFLPLSLLVLASVFIFTWFDEVSVRPRYSRNTSLIHAAIWFSYILSAIFIMVFVFWLVITLPNRPSWDLFLLAFFIRSVHWKTKAAKRRKYHKWRQGSRVLQRFYTFEL